MTKEAKQAKQKRGLSKNKLLRFQKIMEIYNRHKTPDIPTAVVLRKYIYPVYPISRTTLYNILNTPINRELQKIDNDTQKGDGTQ